jgi:hypothetical protein
MACEAQTTNTARRVREILRFIIGSRYGEGRGSEKAVETQ